MSILLIGFEAPESQESASATVLSAVMTQQEDCWGDEVISEFLQVETGSVEEMHQSQSQQLAELIFEHRPDVILFVGQAVGRSRPMLERMGINYFLDQEIVEEAPAAYWQTLPEFDEWPAAFERAGLNLGLSNFAGANVTNHAFYSALHLAETQQLPIDVGLFHLPLLAEQGDDESEAAPSIPGQVAVLGLILLVDGLLDFLEN